MAGEWTFEDTQRLRELWASGLSAMRCGNELGKTKNAVIGRLRRLALLKIGPCRQNHVVLLPLSPVYQEPEPGLLTMEKLTRNMCRWPFGDVGARDFHFCGVPKLDASPYCQEHHSKAFTPGATKKNAQARAERDSGINKMFG